jgi:hypothetical protein
MTPTIIRCEKNHANPYVMIDRRVAEDAALSWKAKGLMSYLLSRPDNWQVRIDDLIKRSADGETAVRSALRELEAHGYIVRERLTEPQSGRFAGIRLTIYERPLAADERSQPERRRHADAADDQGQSPWMESPRVASPPGENPHAADRALLIPEVTKKDDDDVVARQSASVELTTTDPVLAQVVALYEQEIGGNLTAMIHDELTDLVATQCREVERWRAAFRASIGARNRWQYTRAIILHPERKPPKEVNPRDTSSRRSNPRGGGGRRPSEVHRCTLPSREEIERVNREAEARLRELGVAPVPTAPPGL